MKLTPVALLLLLLQPTFAQQDDWLPALRPAIGKRVEVETKQGETFTAKVSAVTADALTLRLRSRDTPLPRTEVLVVRRVIGKTRGERARIGFLVGAGLGALLGVYVGSELNKTSTQVALVIEYGAYHGLIGAGVGAATGGPRYHTNYVAH